MRADLPARRVSRASIFEELVGGADLNSEIVGAWPNLGLGEEYWR